jgi:hypothetical protein
MRSWPDVPTRVLAGRHDRLFSLDFQRRIARERLGLEVDEIDGGHMVAMSNPRELADRLEAYRLERQRDRPVRGLRRSLRSLHGARSRMEHRPR